MADDKIQVVGLTNPKMNPKTKAKIFGAVIGIFVLFFGVGAGIYLVNQNQNINEKAGITYGRCSEGGEACPGSDGILRNCHPPEADDTAVLSMCNEKGRVEFCGTRNYCCPAPGGTWTADMTACATPTPAPTGTPSPSPVPTASPTARPTATTLPSITLSATPSCNNISYRWTAVTGAAGYYLDLSKTSNFSDFVSSDRLSASTTTYTFSSLDSNTNYYARITLADISNFPQYSTKGPIKTTVCATSTSAATTAPTKTATAKATSTSTSSSKTATPTTKATTTSVAQATATTVPVPVTGVSLPTIIGGGFGIIMILVSIALAI